MLRRVDKNPILLPNKKSFWEMDAVFNGCVVEDNNQYHFIYRAMSGLGDHHGVRMNLSSIGYAVGDSTDTFSYRRQLVTPDYDWEAFGCEDPRITKLDGKYYIFYTALSTYPFSPAGIKIGVAVTNDLRQIKEKHLVTHFNSKAMALFPERINGRLFAILTIDTDLPPAKITLASFGDESEIWSNDYWHEWANSIDDHVISLLRSSRDHIEVGAAPIKTNRGWLVIHSYITNYLDESKRTFGIEALLLDLNNPLQVIARTKKPLLEPQEIYELEGKVPNVIFPSGALVQGEELFVYYGGADTVCCLAKCNLEDLLNQMQVQTTVSVVNNSNSDSYNSKNKLTRFSENPIISPIPEFAWEAKATFNPAAVYEQGKVHLIYRAMSNDDTSVLGYASSTDGLHIDERLKQPIYVPREDFEKKTRPGNSGCEDPRITKIDDRFYMCYTAYDGVNPPRIALTSITVDDFLNRKWVWEKPILISPPGVDDKDACILSKKIDGQYVIFHRMENHICINLVDDLNFGENDWLKINPLIEPRLGKWDDSKVGIAAPPIETKDGWLMLYHGVSSLNSVYKVGVVLLGLDDPTQVIARSDQPILEPKAQYEKEGQVPNVVFPCGAVVIENKLFVYYGGGDSVVGVATMDLSKILSDV